MQPPRPDESSLCLACGLCCSGAIFSSVPLAPDDDIAALEGAGIEVLIGGGERRFEQGCAAHDGRACRVYANRPTACRQYRCDLLRRVKDGEADRAEALHVIDEALRLKEQLTEAAGRVAADGWSRKGRTRLIKEFSEELERSPDAEVRRKIGAILVQILAFDGFLRRNFGTGVLDWREPKSSTAL